MSDSTLAPDATASELAGSAFVHFDGSLHASFKTDDFASATAFVVRVAEVADEQNHHPDVKLGYGSACFVLSSHDVGGVTERDLELAKAIEAIAKEMGAAAE